MNKLQNIVNNKWFFDLFFIIAIAIWVFQALKTLLAKSINHFTEHENRIKTGVNNFYKFDYPILIKNIA